MRSKLRSFRYSSSDADAHAPYFSRSPSVAGTQESDAEDLDFAYSEAEDLDFVDSEAEIP